MERFPAISLARMAGERGGTLPAVLNAANEVAVQGFIDGRLSFPQISQCVERVMRSHGNIEHPDLKQILEADAWARGEALRC